MAWTASRMLPLLPLLLCLLLTLTALRAVSGQVAGGGMGVHQTARHGGGYEGGTAWGWKVKAGAGRLLADGGTGVPATCPGDSDREKPALQILWFFGAPEAVAHIGQGETVQWLWWDDMPHSVEGEGAAEALFTGKGGGKAVVAQKGFMYNYTFDEPGVYRYHSRSHPKGMVGTVIVKAKVNPGGVVLPWYFGVSSGGASAVVEEGDTVTWQWGDELSHSIHGVEGSEEVFTGRGGTGSSVTQFGFTYQRTFNKAGKYCFICAQHGDTMRGVVTVVPKGSLAPPSAQSFRGSASYGTPYGAQGGGQRGYGIVFSSEKLELIAQPPSSLGNHTSEVAGVVAVSKAKGGGGGRGRGGGGAVVAGGAAGAGAGVVLGAGGRGRYYPAPPPPGNFTPNAALRALGQAQDWWMPVSLAFAAVALL